MLESWHKILIENWQKGTIQTDSFILLLMAICLFWLLKRISISPRGTLKFWDDFSHRRINQLNKLIANNVLSSEDKAAFKKELRLLLIRKNTGILDRQLILPLWQIICAEEGQLRCTYFKSSYPYIRQNNNGQLELQLKWWFWVFNRLLSSFILVCLVIITFMAFIAVIFFSVLAFRYQFSILPVLLAGIIFFISIMLAAYHSASSLTRGRIKKTRDLLAKYADKINEDVSDKFMS